ncbi:hypothetical protein [Cytobacillus oceanisediminis]|uniref:hypothetical protein n=1 Tax=Cytobacillus oceanisediminis TaxID=665099 RepID=UPI002079D1EA|nr:hypothetical protein [Cytobacillus oceanisediminis]USK46567.1 hypothetical protein LIT27_12165 [Cytobacillus oceanisediminis]
MATVYSTGISIPSNGSGSLNRPVPSTPGGITLAAFGLPIPQPQAKVILNGTIGITASILNPTLIIQVFRGDQVIFSAREETQLAIGQSQTISFTAAELNVPVSSNQAYSMVIRVENPIIILNGATVTGPVTFTGVAYSAV